MAAATLGPTDTLLVELRVEELPPKALHKLGTAFAAGLHAGLQAQGLVDAQATATAYATPRRLAAQIAGVAERAADRSQLVKLMPPAVGLDAEGQPTPALRKKLVALGAGDVPVAELKRAPDGKGEALFLDTVVPGATLVAALQEVLADTLAALPIPKVMRYQLADGWTSVHFVRPAHGLVALHGSVVVPVTALGLTAGRNTLGHRFEAALPTIVVRSAQSYADQLLAEGAVIASFEARRDELQRQLQLAAVQQGLQPIDDAALIDEVTALVERPHVLVCRFEPEFLAVPQECLILTMKANQKYFPLLDAAGRLTERFLVVSNIAPADPSRVVEGNERVVRPRLADAKFFFDQDRKRTLESRRPALDKVVYHARLGSVGERVRRVQSLVEAIGRQLGDHRSAAAVPHAARAAMLAKADLTTDMVGEFPELQGVMGGYYARHDGEPAAVAQAIEDHYKPRYAGDDLPRSDHGDAGLLLALADKLETLGGLFGIGQLPSGDKDPYALRRHALGVIRMLVERQLPLDLPALLAAAVPAGDAGASALAELQRFVLDRLTGYLRERGYTALEVDAVVSQQPRRLADVPARLDAVRRFAQLPEAASLAAANKRVGNILKKSEAGVAGQGGVDPVLLREPAEAALAQALQDIAPAADAAFERGDYAASLQALAALKAPVDAFFDAVMVNAEDPALRRNRLALLARLHAAMNRVADLSRLAS